MAEQIYYAIQQRCCRQRLLPLMLTRCIRLRYGANDAPRRIDYARAMLLLRHDVFAMMALRAHPHCASASRCFYERERVDAAIVLPLSASAALLCCQPLRYAMSRRRCHIELHIDAIDITERHIDAAS